MGKLFIIITIILVYVIGYVISLITLKRCAKQLGLDHYDDNDRGYVMMDDYESNESAWISFSFVWPVFWFIIGIIGFFKFISNQSEKFLNKLNNEKT